MDYAKEYPVAMKAITEWIGKGLLKRKFHIVNGLDAAPGALPLLYSGGNTGKLCVASFVLGKLISYLALPGSLRSPSTKPRLSSKLCDCLHAVICPLIFVVLAYHPAFITIFTYQSYPLLGTMYMRPGAQPGRENRLSALLDESNVFHSVPRRNQ